MHTDEKHGLKRRDSREGAKENSGNADSEVSSLLACLAVPGVLPFDFRLGG